MFIVDRTNERADERSVCCWYDISALSSYSERSALHDTETVVCSCNCKIYVHLAFSLSLVLSLSLFLSFFPCPVGCMISSLEKYPSHCEMVKIRKRNDSTGKIYYLYESLSCPYPSLAMSQRHVDAMILEW